MQTQSKALPAAWVDRLFALFGAMYGAKLTALWEGSSIEDVKAVWGADLWMFSGVQIGWAVETCKDRNPFPPTLPEFRTLCRAAPRPELPALEEPRIDPLIAEARAKEAQEKLANAMNNPCPYAWALKILANIAAGYELYPMVSEQYAVEALANLDKLSEAPEAYVALNRRVWQNRKAAA